MKEKIAFFLDAQIRKKEIPVKEIEQDFSATIINVICAYGSCFWHYGDKNLIRYYNGKLKRFNVIYGRKNLAGFLITCDQDLKQDHWNPLRGKLCSNFHPITIDISENNKAKSEVKQYIEPNYQNKGPVLKQQVLTIRKEMKNQILEACRKTLVPTQL